MLLRLDPLVSEVVVDMSATGADMLTDELGTRLPLRIDRDVRASVDYTVGVGAFAERSDLIVDAAGWVAAIGQPVHAVDDGNPIGPLAGAALACADVFKRAFTTTYPERAALVEMIPWRGQFSLFSYELDDVSPLLPEVISIAATLVGLGGVGAGVIRTIAALRDRISGTLNLVDRDILTADNLNRVSYATLAGALAGTAKVVEAKTYLHQRCPNLTVVEYAETFDAYKGRIHRRAERIYDVVVTGLDDDQIRWEVQRDLPRILIDGSTGNDMVARVERVEFGLYGCLGCSRRPTLARSEAACDAPPDPYAPSLSFLSSFPGVLAAGEILKEVMASGSLRGSFDHVFRYGPNPDLVGTPAIRQDCAVGCSRPSKLSQYQQKYRARFPL
jgi:hypothetical protein